MTLDQFKAQGWAPDMRCEYGGAAYTIAAVDFAENLVGLENPLDDCKIAWVRCENVNLLQNNGHEPAATPASRTDLNV